MAYSKRRLAELSMVPALAAEIVDGFTPTANDWAAASGIVTTARPKAALLGDSRAAYAHQTTGTTVSVNGYGPAFHAEMRSGGRVDFPQRLNFAVGGIQTPGVSSLTFATIAKLNDGKRPAGNPSRQTLIQSLETLMAA